MKYLLAFLVGSLSLTYPLAKSIVPNQLNERTSFSFDDVIPNKFGQRGFGGTWISGSEFTFSVGGNFTKFNVATQSSEVILSKDFIDQHSWVGPSFRFSADLQKILVRHSQRQIFRHSTVSKYSIVFPGTAKPEFLIANGKEVQIAFFSPNGNGLAYIESNNIYYLSFDNLDASPKEITTDGVPGVIYNGIPDWVYEEEVLGTDAATWFSPDGKRMAFVRFDDTEVKESVYDIYGEGERQYPLEVKLRYPKAGTTNPTVDLYIVTVDGASGKTRLGVPTEKVGADHILGTVFWVNDLTLGAIWLNRRQNAAVFVTYDAITYTMSEIYGMNEPNGWIDVNTPKCDAESVCYFLDNNNNWPKLTKIDTKNKQDVSRLSSDGMNVLSLYGIGSDGVTYFVSTPSREQSYNRHVYSSINNSPTCLTCGVQTPEGNLCTYATASFSRDFSHYSMTCSGPNPSFVKFFRTNGNREISTWEDNQALRTELEKKNLPQIKIFHVPISGGFQAVVKMMLPDSVDFEGSVSTVQHPMLVRVYAGPGSVRVSSSFGIGYQTYQVTSNKIIHVEIDGRGMAQNGNDMMYSVNNKLGTLEIEDQIEVTKYLINRFKFIDPKKVGIWGWSYGGYATAMALGQDAENVFKCGISVAPVTSWRFYDTIYTERYMGINQNALNYNTSDVAFPERINNIGKHDFFLIHGNADDNVHYQQSMVLARALEKADIQFEQLSYPDEAHSISGTSRHLYHSMDRFWHKCFGISQ